MLSSIHPLGERARKNRWWLTVAAFAAGSTVTAAAFGAALGAIGTWALAGISDSDLLLMTAAIAFIAGLLDLLRVVPPGPRRQVNETWIGTYRGWVYGGAFGVQLGAGLATYVVTWGVYATFAAEVLTASPMTGAVVGTVFGVGRSLPLVAAGFIDRPSRLTSFNRRLAHLGPTFRSMVALTLGVVGIVTLAGGLTWRV